MKQEVAEVQQAITAVKKEERQRETYNRFKEYAKLIHNLCSLQRRFSKQFLYHRDINYGQPNKVPVLCRVSYISFEARLDRVSFELTLRETKPQNIILLNASKRQEQKIRDFITSQSLHLNLYSQPEHA